MRPVAASYDEAAPRIQAVPVKVRLDWWPRLDEGWSEIKAALVAKARRDSVALHIKQQEC